MIRVGTFHLISKRCELDLTLVHLYNANSTYYTPATVYRLKLVIKRLDN